MKAIPSDFLAGEYLGIITMAFDRYVLGTEDIESGIRASAADIDMEIGLFYEGIMLV